MQRKPLLLLLLISCSTCLLAGTDPYQTGHYIGGIGGGYYTGGGNDNPIGGVYSATVRWDGHGNNYELVTYNTPTMTSCQNHVNASVGVGASVVRACHYVP